MLLDVSTPKLNAFSIENLAKSSTNDKRTLIIGNQQTFNTMQPLPPLLPIPMTQHYGSTNVQAIFNQNGMHTMTPKRKRDESGSDESEKEVKRAPSRESYTSRQTLSPTLSGSSSQGDSDPDLTPARTSKKKSRTTFSTDQIQGLETAYGEHKYLSAADRSVLAKKLALSDQQNRRMKEKRQEKEEDQPKGIHIPTGGVDISQLAALGLPCPPPPTISQKNGGPLSRIQPATRRCLLPLVRRPNQKTHLLDKCHLCIHRFFRGTPS
ncbi:hypothetical protein ScPMuIL_001457 [Solemya velum]